jgi:hypothetical protein
MKFVLKEERIGIFINILETLAKCNNFITFTFEDNRLYSQGLDTSHCCFYELIIPIAFFDSYTYDLTHTKVITIDVPSKLIAHLNNISKDSKYVVFEYENDGLSISFFNNNNNIESIPDRCLELYLVDYDSFSNEIPFREYSLTMKLNNDLKRLIKSHLSTCDDFITISLNENEDDGDFYLKICSETFKDQSNIIFKRNDNNYLIGEEYLDFEQSYSSKLLLPYYNINGFDTSFKISNELPLVITHTYKNLISLDIYVAPKIDGND